MQKSGITLIVSGLLIVVGLILLVVGNQIVLDGVSQGNGKVNTDQYLTVSGEFAPDESTSGVYAIQIMEFSEDTFSAEILDPSGIRIASHGIDSDSVEEEFAVDVDGTYSLVVHSNMADEVHVFGAIGPLPDAGKKSIGFLSAYVLIVGMIGLVISGVYGIKKRRSV